MWEVLLRAEVLRQTREQGVPTHTSPASPGSSFHSAGLALGSVASSALTQLSTQRSRWSRSAKSSRCSSAASRRNVNGGAATRSCSQADAQEPAGEQVRRLRAQAMPGRPVSVLGSPWAGPEAPPGDPIMWSRRHRGLVGRLGAVSGRSAAAHVESRGT